MWLVKCFTEAWISATFSGRSADGSTDRISKMPSSHIWENPLEPTFRCGWLFRTKLNNWSLETMKVCVFVAMAIVRRTKQPPKFDVTMLQWRHDIENRNNFQNTHITSPKYFRSVAVPSTVDLNERGNLDEHESRWKLAKIYFSIWKILWST